VIAFTVAGVPAPQGSKTRTKWGMREDNAATRPWREAVAWAATEAMMGGDPAGQSRILEQGPPMTGPLVLTATFYFPRPKAHYRTGKHAGELRPDAPFWHSVKPDGDKLVRAIGDALAGIVARDDAQFAQGRWQKLYGSPRAEVTIDQLAQP
jgi:Holliday junction resolvase RusA-like endonuclease